MAKVTTKALKADNAARKVSKVAKPAKAGKVATKGKAKASKAAPVKVKAKAASKYIRKPGCGIEFDPAATLRVVSDGNPKREGSKAWHRYQAMLTAYVAKGGKFTVGDALAARFGRDDIRWGIGMGQLVVDGAKAGDDFARVSQAKVTPNVAKAALAAARADVKAHKADPRKLREAAKPAGKAASK